MREDILSRATTSTASLTPVQAQVDSAVSSGTREIADPKFIAASLVGGGAGVGIFEAGFKIRSSLFYRGASSTIRSLFAPIPVTLVGAFVGSTIHEFTYRSLENLSEGENPNRWKFGGKDGVGLGLIRSYFAFGNALISGQNSFMATDLILNDWSMSRLSPEFIKRRFFNIGVAAGILTFFSVYWLFSKGFNYLENLNSREERASDPSLKKADSSPASDR